MEQCSLFHSRTHHVIRNRKRSPDPCISRAKSASRGKTFEKSAEFRSSDRMGTEWEWNFGKSYVRFSMRRLEISRSSAGYSRCFVVFLSPFCVISLIVEINLIAVNGLLRYLIFIKILWKENG